MKSTSPTWQTTLASHRYQGPIVLPTAAGRRGVTRSHATQPRRRSQPQPRFRQLLDEQHFLAIAGGRQLWLAVAKALLAAAPLLLAMQWYLHSTCASYERSLAECHTTNQLLLENRAALDNLLNRLSSPERIRVMAEEKLSLHRPGKEQVQVF